MVVRGARQTKITSFPVHTLSAQADSGFPNNIKGLPPAAYLRK